jgi:diadenosine tetraphosphate (Ap4A) HIT family hydrolase
VNLSNGPCELCSNAGGDILWQSPLCRIVRVADDDFPGFCRVIWQTHVREMSDLSEPEQSYLMAVVLRVESVVRALFEPDKINLASFGNVVPHLHWHIIPRWSDDRNFPEPIWGRVQRETRMARPQVSDAELAAALVLRLANLPELPGAS